MSWSFLCSFSSSSVIVRFVDNGEIVDNHYLNFLFIKQDKRSQKWKLNKKDNNNCVPISGGDILFSFCPSVTNVCTRKFFYTLHRHSSKLWMYAYCYMKIHISLYNFDRTILRSYFPFKNLNISRNSLYVHMELTQIIFAWLLMSIWRFP